MAPKPLPPLAEMAELIAYDPDTGVFTNRVTRNNCAKAGAVTGCRNGIGYITIRHKKSLYLAHRLAWLFLYGNDPGAMDVDHINGDQSDNRACNLRVATHRQNLRNSKTPITNTSGHKGVYWCRKRWVAYTKTDKGRVHIGTFTEFDLAVAAYRSFVNQTHGEFARY